MTQPAELETRLGAPVRPRGLSEPEFVCLAASLTALFSISIDGVLPALGLISREFGVTENQGQFLVGALIIGIAVGQAFYGPISDSTGRKIALYLALFVFAAGTVLSLFALSFSTILAGRILQGLGAGGTRTITIALVRDQYEGATMARIMSLMTAVLVTIPMAASGISQVLVLISGWKAVFIGLLVFDALVLVWLGLRQPETHPIEKRSSFSARLIAVSATALIHSKIARRYTIALSLILGGWLGYVNSARQILQDVYGAGALFPLYFATSSVAFGLSSLLNARLVKVVPLKLLCYAATLTIGAISAVFLATHSLAGVAPTLPAFLFYVFLVFLCLGLVISNLTALAMEPLGQIAGIGAGIIGTLSWFSGALIGAIVGQLFNGTATPVITCFFIVSATSIAVMHSMPARASAKA